MATAKELLEAGQLQAAIDALLGEVKAAPTDLQRRTFLFELLCFAGEFDRAERQLDVVGHQSAQAEIGVQVYRNNIKAERDRRRLWSDGLQPHFLTEPPAYIDWHLNAINRLREGHGAEARSLLDQAEEERPALAGQLNGRPFTDCRDYNDFTGPVLELIIKDQYTWLPLEQVKKLELAAPKQLRDLLWAPAQVETTDGTIGEVFLFTLYAGSHDHANEQVKLGRMTDWQDLGADLLQGAGLRLFFVDGQDKALLEIRQLTLGAAAGAPSAHPS